MAAANYNLNPEMIATLLKAGADVKAQTKDGYTALMFAAGQQNPEVITMLLKAGADVRAWDTLAMTALMWAAVQNQNPEVITMLLRAGADLEDADIDGDTPLMAFDYAKFNEKLKNTDACRKLQQASQ